MHNLMHSCTTMYLAQYDGQVCPLHWAKLFTLMGRVAQGLGHILTMWSFGFFALYAPSAPRSGPRAMPAARPVWGPYGKAPRFPPALRFVCFCENFPLPAQKSPRFFGRPPFLCYLCIRFRPQAGRVPAGASFFERIYIKDREKVVQESGIPLPARPMPCGAGVSV